MLFKKHVLQLIACILFLSMTSVASACDMHGKANSKITLQESYQVEIPKLNVNLDNGKYDITVYATWLFKPNPNKEDYVDSNLVVNDIKQFLANYPKKTDFWEVINHNLSSFLINKYHQCSAITIKIDVPASMFDPYQHISEVTARR